MGATFARMMGGALQGLGAGLAYQGQQDAEVRRQAALERLRAESAQASTEHQYDLMDRNAGRQAARQNYYGAQDAEREFKYKSADREDDQAFKAEHEQREQANRIALENVKHSHNLSEAQQKQALDLAAEAEKQGSYVKEYRVSADGQLMAFNGRGMVIARSRTAGAYVPPGGGGGDEPLGTGLGGGRPAPAAATAQRAGPAPATSRAAERPTGQRPQGTISASYEQAKARLGQVYATATPDSHPGLFRNGRKISQAEAIRMLDERFGR